MYLWSLRFPNGGVPHPLKGHRPVAVAQVEVAQSLQDRSVNSNVPMWAGEPGDAATTTWMVIPQLVVNVTMVTGVKKPWLYPVYKLPKC